MWTLNVVGYYTVRLRSCPFWTRHCNWFVPLLQFHPLQSGPHPATRGVVWLWHPYHLPGKAPLFLARPSGPLWALLHLPLQPHFCRGPTYRPLFLCTKHNINTFISEISIHSSMSADVVASTWNILASSPLSKILIIFLYQDDKVSFAHASSELAGPYLCNKCQLAFKTELP